MNPPPILVESIGADGDGTATLPNGDALFLPNTLPGELVQPGTLTRRGKAWTADATVETPSPDRVTPPCPHFGPCGGCALQHWADAPYAAWKHAQLEQTVRRLGFTAELPALHRTPPAARRRMDLALRREPGGAILIGLHARRSPTIVNMHACPVMHPTLFRLIEALRPILRSLDGFRREGSAIVNLLDTGPDLLLRTDSPLTARDRTHLTALATAQHLPRISWAQGSRDTPEPACLLRPATNTFGGHVTPIPPGAFLQASLEGEAAIQAAVLAALPSLPPKARIIELFAGVGTLTHALATRARVQAFEGDLDAIKALRAANNPRIEATQRDLARQPLQAVDLKGAATIVLDPPWNGAMAQIPALAASRLPIVYVTCNPAALLRDARLLTQAGYQIASAIPIDQFLWSPRIEGIVTFSP